MNNEKGFTLIEAVAGLAIAAFVSLGALSTTYQTLKVTTQDNAWATAVRQAQNIGFWTSQDAQSATQVQGTAGQPGDGVTFMSLVWDDWGTGDQYQVDYVWKTSTHGLFGIERHYSKNGTVQIAVIANSIVGTGTSFQQAGTAWKLTVVTQAGNSDVPVTVTREYLIETRPTIHP